MLDFSGNDITTSIQGGQLGGAIQIRDQVIPGLSDATQHSGEPVHGQLQCCPGAGFRFKWQCGPELLHGSASGAAAGMSVAISDPSLVAISSDGSAGGNGNVANLSAALTNALPSGQTVAQAYANLVYQVGTAASNASAQSTAIGQNLLQLNNQQGSISGVSIDEETTNLIRFQTAYEAAARIVSTIQQLDTVTINMIS